MYIIKSTLVLQKRTIIRGNVELTNGIYVLLSDEMLIDYINKDEVFEDLEDAKAAARNVISKEVERLRVAADTLEKTINEDFSVLER